jgi:transcriptional regulator with XRE-family HTH domain
MAKALTERQRAFGATLGRWRKQRRLTVQALADLADCSHSTISDVENGKRAATAGLLWKLAPHLFPEEADRYAVWGQLCEEAGIEWFGRHAREREPVSSAALAPVLPRRGSR